MINTSPSSDSKFERHICPFWWRIWAFCLDILILGIFGFILGLIFEQQFVEMGSYGRLIGFLIVLFYFGILNSRLGNGQSIGKRVLKIKVVSKEGQYISPLKSVIRTFILGIPYFVNVALVPTSSAIQIISMILQAIITWMGASVLYLYLFNRSTRQALHDLICGTYVVSESFEESINVNPVPKVHYIVLVGIMLAILAISFIPNAFLQKETMRQLLTLQKQIVTSTNITNVSVTEGTIYSSGISSQYVTATIYIKKQKDSDILAKNVAKTILKINDYKQRDSIKVTTVYGYDIGIYSYYYHHNYEQTPQEWLGKFNN
jgi:uncharacterized RDD family membrane protein YckC